MKNRPLSSPLPVPPATRAEAAEFLKGLQRFRAKGQYPFEESEVKKFDDAGVKAYLDKMTAGSQQAISRRIMMDILKSSPITGGETAKRRRKPKSKKTAAKVKTTRRPKKRGTVTKREKSSRHS